MSGFTQKNLFEKIFSGLAVSVVWLLVVWLIFGCFATFNIPSPSFVIIIIITAEEEMVNIAASPHIPLLLFAAY